MKKIISILCVILVIMVSILPTMVNAASSTYTQTVKSGIESFPETYQTYLRKIKELHPNWTFDAYYTGISWDTLVAKETDCGHNRIIRTANALWRDGCGNVESGYACASHDIIKYYMDPRNFINDDVKIFQFLEISYNSRIHTVQGVQSTIASTFMNSDYRYNKDGAMLSYADIIIEAAKQSNMSPYSIATKIIQEVGTNGSASVSGRYPGYEGLYNFYNYGANDEGDAIANGLRYARDHGWTNPYVAIIEGAKLLANSYTNLGQNTAYFYKWDVVGSRILKVGETQTVVSSTNLSENQLFRHQYMTNVQDPTSQAKNTYSTYVKNNILDEALNFVIPVYDNMYTYNKLPTNLTSADGPLYYMIGTDVMVRQAPNTSGTILASMSTLDEIVVVLERHTSTDSTGRKWDKVKLSSGIVGYMASQYLLPCAVEEVKPEEPSAPIETKQTVEAKINNEFIITTPLVTGNKAAELLNITNFELHKKETKIDVAEKIGTGYIFKDINGQKNYTAVVLGDINGDSEINSGDLLQMKKHLLGTLELSDASKKAGNVNCDEELNSGDLLSLKKYLLGTLEISLK